MPNSGALAWLEKADEDEAAIRALVSAKGPWSMAIYHAQQSAEKCLKAALAARDLAPPKTHDLVRLVATIPVGSRPKTLLDCAADLTTYAWITRYPGGPEITFEDLEDALAQLEVIRAWALEVIQSTELSSQSATDADQDDSVAT